MLRSGSSRLAMAGRRLVAAVAVAWLCGGAAYAQGPLNLVRGSVQDQTGAVVPGVQVQIVDAAGDVRGETLTDASGSFVFQGLPAGTYEIRASFEGFKPASAKVRIAPGRVVPAQKLILALANIRQEITVGREGEPVTTAADANRDAIVIDDKALKNLPIFDRDIVGTLSRFLDPGALGTGGATLVVDGMEARKVGVAPSAILQVKINQDPYSAEFPRSGRGRIEVVTKPGSEDYHGTVDLTFRDAHLNARDAFATIRPPEQRRIYEGFLGGPILGGKNSSFLLTVDRREEDLQAVVFASAPSGLVQGVVPQPRRTVEVSGTANHQQGKNHTFSLRFTGERQNSHSQGVGGTTLAEAGSDDHSDEEQAVIGHRWTLTDHLFSEFRLLVGREIQNTTSLRPGLRIVVLDAFTSGSAQSDQRTTEHHAQLSEALTYSRGRHLLKAGVQVPDWSRRGYDDRTNREGTFTFASLLDYTAGLPLSFAQQRGDGRLVFLQKVFGAFVQDQVTIRPDLSVGLGVRYDWQNIFDDRNNFAPRASIAYAPGKRTVIRAGAGVFYDRANEGALHDLLRSREARLFRYLLLQPSYPDPFASASANATPAANLVQLAPNVRTPFTFQYSAGVERQLRKGTTIALNYAGSRGVGLFRSLDINAPPPPAYAVRPNPAFGQIRQIESDGRQHTDSLQLVLRGQMAPRIQGSAQYTVGFAHNDTSGINAFPANNTDLSGEWSRADFDQRHRLDVLGQFKGGAWLNFGVSLSLASGRPYSLRTGRDDYHTGQTNARPPGVPRNSLEGPGFAGVDFRWSREIAFGAAGHGDRPAITFGVDAFNVVNRVNFSSYVGNLSSPFFGRPISAQPPRRIQLTAGITF